MFRHQWQSDKFHDEDNRHIERLEIADIMICYRKVELYA